MGKTFRVGNRESKLLSRIESSKERERYRAIAAVRDNIDPFSNKVAMKLVETGLIETVSKNSIQDQIAKCLDKLTRAEDFDMISTSASIKRQPNFRQPPDVNRSVSCLEKDRGVLVQWDTLVCQ